MPTKAAAKKDTTKKPKLGEDTGSQIDNNVVVRYTMVSDPDSPGTYANYRRMRNNPTVALSRAAFQAPIKASTPSVNSDDAASEDMIALIDDNLIPMWPWIVHNTLYGMDYGHADAEKVFEVRDGRLRLKKIKPLLADKTRVLVDKATGSFGGLRQGSIDLPPEKVFHWTYDMEAGNLYGRSWFENIRTEWQAWQQVSQKFDKYMGKVAGTVPIINYPQGELVGPDKSKRSNEEHATRILEGLGRGAGVAIPVKLFPWAQDLLKRGMDPMKLLTWQISFLETKTAHGADFIASLQHLEKQLSRGLLVPERMIQEGTHGTLAESSAHADVSMMISQEVLDDIVRHVNWYIVDQLLVLNWGESARGLVWIETAPLVDEAKAFVRSLILAVISPVTSDLLETWFDLDQVFDSLGLPKRKELIQGDALDRLPDETPQAEAERVGAAVMARVWGDMLKRRNGNGR